MKKLALTFCVLLGLTGVARAQQNPTVNFVMPISAQCIEARVADATLLATYGEQPIAEGVGIVLSSQRQEYVSVLVKVYLNLKTNSFTIAYDVPNEGMTCIVSAGNDFKPATKRPKY